MSEGVWKGVYPQVFGRSKQLSLNKFFDPSTPSMRKLVRSTVSRYKMSKNDRQTDKQTNKQTAVVIELLRILYTR